MPEKRLDKYLAVLLFALLHGVLAEASILIGFNVVLLLTMLTMVMSLYLSIRQQMGLPFMVAAVVLINFIGLWLGQWMGVMVRRYLITEAVPLRHYIAGPLSTLLTTCILGAAQVEISLLIRKIPGFTERKGNPFLLIPVFVGVLGVRMAMMVSSSSFWDKNVELSLILDYVCSMALLLWMAYYALHARQMARDEQKKRREAQYSYDRLKKQIEPHFLFNSLNTLGNIVNTGRNGEAMDYIRKLSSIYRYLLENEEELTIYLYDELAFVQEYAELMKIRFPEGWDIRVNVDEACRSRSIIPCSLQLLVENAMKHNAISAREPLCIEIFNEGDYVVVKNNLIPKISAQPSTGNGQRYIRNRYRDETGKEIVIMKTDDFYIVKLPLL